MAVTTHYIDNNKHLRNHMLRFIYVPAPHIADRLATIIVDCIVDWNVDAKASTITLNNCNTDDKMMDIIKMKLVPSYLIKDGDLLHIGCPSHILNLIVKDGMDVLKGGIKKIIDSVIYWTTTPKKLEFFQEAAKQLCISCEKRLVCTLLRGLYTFEDCIRFIGFSLVWILFIGGLLSV
ncbi:Putative AC transposase [Linum perenne]